MNVIDSSGWLEYFAGGKNAGFFAPAVEQTAKLIVPSVSLLEVFKKILRESSESNALQAIAIMQAGRVIQLDATLAVVAAKLGHDLKLPLADSIMYATSQVYKATLWTQDADFKDLQGVRYTNKTCR